MKTTVAKALTVAGSDSGGGAGIQADLKTFAALGVYGCSVVTAVTAQNTRAVTGIHDIPVEIVSAQLEAVLSDLRPDAVKTGMLSNSGIIHAVVACLKQYRLVPLVVDPVMVAKSGDALLAPEAVTALKTELLSLATVVTPNIPEAEVLVGKHLVTQEDFREACLKIHDMGPGVVVLKGGHKPRSLSDQTVVIDLVYDGETFLPVEGPFVETVHTHGTGCTFASAIAAGLAKGMEPYLAIVEARQYLTAALQAAYPVGSGKGPVHHFHRWWAARAQDKREPESPHE